MLWLDFVSHLKRVTLRLKTCVTDSNYVVITINDQSSDTGSFADLMVKSVGVVGIIDIMCYIS